MSHNFKTKLKIIKVFIIGFEPLYLKAQPNTACQNKKAKKWIFLAFNLKNKNMIKSRFDFPFPQHGLEESDKNHSQDLCYVALK